MKTPNAFYRLLLLIVCATTAFKTNGQYKHTNFILSPELTDKESISGIVCINDSLYMVSERSGALYVASLNSNVLIKRSPLSTSKDSEIEGLTAYENDFYIVSENDTSIYHVNLSKGGLLQKVNTGFKFPKPEGDGLEGIAANEKNKKIYILLERDAEKKNALIYTFNAKMVDGKIKLTYEKTDFLNLGNISWRYSDIFYDSLRDRLICLKSYYRDKIGKYAIESIKIDEKGNLSGAPKVIENLDSIKLTEFVNSYTLVSPDGMKYNSNVEGITITKDGTIYLASDNHWGSLDKPHDKNRKTLVLKLYK